MAVYKRGAKGVFYMNFTVNGVRVFRSTAKFTKKEARHVEVLEKQKLISGECKQQKVAKVLLQDAIDQVYDSRWKNNKDGMGSYRRACGLVTHLGNVAISSIDDDVVDELVCKLEETCIEISTVNRYLAGLKTILKHFRLRTAFIRFRKEKNGRIRVLSKEEEINAVELLRGGESKGKKAYYTESGDMVEVLVDTGMRLSELLDLKYEDVNFNSNLISIWFNKGDRPRSLPMTRRVRNILEERQCINKIKPFNISVDEAERAWQWMRAEIGLKADSEFVLHALRHTCASRLVNAGVDLYVVKEWLGHSSIQITEKYAHLAPDKLAHAAAILDDFK